MQMLCRGRRGLLHCSIAVLRSGHGEEITQRLWITYLEHFSLVSMEVIAAVGKEPDLDGNLAVQRTLQLRYFF